MRLVSGKNFNGAWEFVCHVFRFLCTAGGLFFATTSSADLVIDFADTPTSVVTFEGTLAGVNQNKFLGEGLASSPSFGQLDSDSWEVDAGSELLPFGGSATTGTIFGAGNSPGNTNVAGLYSFDTGGGNIALGIQPHIDHFTPGTIILRVLNDTGATVSSWDVSYDIFAYNDTNASTSIDFSYAVGTTTPGTFNPLSLDFDSPFVQDVVAAWGGPTNKSTSIAASVADGTHLFLKWTFNSTGGTSVVHDEVALDNISVTAVSAVPEPSAALFGLVVILTTAVRIALKRNHPSRTSATSLTAATSAGSILSLRRLQCSMLTRRTARSMRASAHYHRGRLRASERTWPPEERNSAYAVGSGIDANAEPLVRLPKPAFRSRSRLRPQARCCCSPRPKRGPCLAKACCANQVVRRIHGTIAVVIPCKSEHVEADGDFHQATGHALAHTRHGNHTGLLSRRCRVERHEMDVVAAQRRVGTVERAGKAAGGRECVINSSAPNDTKTSAALLTVTAS